MDLTVKKLKEVFGTNYPVINDLVKNRPDDYVFLPNDLFVASDYIAISWWTRADIGYELRRYGYEGTDEEIDDVLAAEDLDDALNDVAFDQQWDCIREACELAGYPCNKVRCI